MNIDIIFRPENAMPEQIGEKVIEPEILVYQNAECLKDAQDVKDAINNVSHKLNKDLQATNPLVLVTMTGGVVFAGQLLPLLKFPLEVDYCQVSRYRSGKQSGELEWITQPKISLENRTLIILDDIYDEGTTLLELIRNCQLRGAKKVVSCVLVNKIHNRKKNPAYIPDYIALELPDRFLVGYGMDYKGLGRNLPGIYAID